MHRIGWVMIVCGLCCATAVAAADEAPLVVEFPQPAYVTLMLARDGAVHRELALSAAQIEQVLSAVAEVDQPLWLLRDLPPEKSRDQLEKHQAQLSKHLATILSASQRERFEQLVLQGRGFRSLPAKDVGSKLKLSTDQTSRLTDLLREPDGKTTAAAGKNDGVAPRAAPNGPPASIAEADVLKILTSQQQSQLSALCGTPFDFKSVRRVGCMAPELRGINTWINSEPLGLAAQHGKVVALHFWTFGCVNCTRNLPHYQAWSDKFPAEQLLIVGLHTPETATERNVDSVRQNMAQRKIAYPVAIDADAANWKAWGNHMWPSVYLIDKQGQVRYWWYGELNWQGAQGEQFLRLKIAELIGEK